MQKLFEVSVPLSGIYSACPLGLQICISLSKGNEEKKALQTCFEMVLTLSKT